MLCHGPGDIQGEPLDLDDEFRAFIWRCYEVYGPDRPQAGRRAFRRAFLSRPKGRAKSELAAAIACAEALGPVRFDHWAERGETDQWGYEFEEGDPVGVAVTMPEVLCLATEEGQAGNTFDGIVYMLRNGAVADEYPGLDVGLTRVFLPGGGVIEPVTSSAKSKDGGKSTFVVADEVHLWTTSELHKVYNTVTRNITKRRAANGWLLATSTMYGPGEGSVAEVIHQSVANRPDAGLLFDHRQAPDVDLADDDALRAALIYVYGSAAAWTNVEGIIEDEFRDPTKSEADNRRYWLNQPHKLAGRMLDPARLRRLEATRRQPAAGSRVVLGFDGSKSRDATALVAWTVEDGPHLFKIRIWTRPADAPDDWLIPRHEVHQAIAEAMDRYDVARLVCDPPGWYSEIDQWTELYGEDRVLLFDTNWGKKMGPACDRFLVAFEHDEFTWDGDSVLRSHLHHLEVKASRWGPLVVKPDGKASEKIDAGVAAIIAYSELGHVAKTTAVPQVWDLNEVVEQLRNRQAEQGESGQPGTPTTFTPFAPAQPGTPTTPTAETVYPGGVRFIRF